MKGKYDKYKPVVAVVIQIKALMIFKLNNIVAVTETTIPKITSKCVTEKALKLSLIKKKEERNSFLKLFGKTIIPVVISYAIFTIVRDFTEDFANELWIETGYQNKINIFAQLSTFVSIIVLIIISSFFLIKDNFKAFSVSLKRPPNKLV